MTGMDNSALSTVPTSSLTASFVPPEISNACQQFLMKFFLTILPEFVLIFQAHSALHTSISRV